MRITFTRHARSVEKFANLSDGFVGTGKGGNCILDELKQIK
jgi:hypothetical protein